MPAYNEGKCIGSLALQAHQYADEVVVVDDGSTDKTSKVAELAGATVVRYTENKGYGSAIRTIVAEAQNYTVHPPIPEQFELIFQEGSPLNFEHRLG